MAARFANDPLQEIHVHPMPRKEKVLGLAVVGLTCHCTMPLAPTTSIAWLAAVMGVIAGLLLTRWDDLAFLIMSRPPQRTIS